MGKAKNLPDFFVPENRAFSLKILILIPLRLGVFGGFRQRAA